MRSLALALAMVFATTATLPLVAEARRIGGGGAIGMQRSLPPRAAPAAVPARPAAPTAQPADDRGRAGRRAEALVARADRRPRRRSRHRRADEPPRLRCRVRQHRHAAVAGRRRGRRDPLPDAPLRACRAAIRPELRRRVAVARVGLVVRQPGRGASARIASIPRPSRRLSRRTCRPISTRPRSSVSPR